MNIVKILNISYYLLSIYNKVQHNISTVTTINTTEFLTVPDLYKKIYIIDSINLFLIE